MQETIVNGVVIETNMPILIRDGKVEVGVDPDMAQGISWREDGMRNDTRHVMIGLADIERSIINRGSLL